MKNPDCDGDESICKGGPSEVRLLPLGGGGNALLCRLCHAHEAQQRRERGESEPFPAYEDLKVYDLRAKRIAVLSVSLSREVLSNEMDRKLRQARGSEMPEAPFDGIAINDVLADEPVLFGATMPGAKPRRKYVRPARTRGRR